MLPSLTRQSEPLQLSFKKGHGLGFYEFKRWEIWKNRDHHRNPREKLHRMGWVPIQTKNTCCFGHFSARCSLLNHHISSPGTSENHRKTCSERSWRYGYDPVHIAYPSTRNTSENRSFFSNIWHFFRKLSRKNICLKWVGFCVFLKRFFRFRILIKNRVI